MSISSKYYTVIIEDPMYSSWKLQPEQSHDLTSGTNETPADPKILHESPSLPDITMISPLKHTLFHGDVITCCNAQVERIRSPTRESSYLCGVLILEGNKTYGRTHNQKRLLYRVIPEQKQLPPFLVPYEIKHAFHKAHTNKYILFQFDHWTSTHPNGKLTEVLGDVNQLSALYEYQLYSKQLHGSIKEITTKVQQCTKKQTLETYMNDMLLDPRYGIEDRTHIGDIFTIDSLHTQDFDDALHITKDNAQARSGTVTVYVANVTLWMEHFQLWEVGSNRVATVYAPDHRRPMLPNILSEHFCSLQKLQRRFAFAIDFHFTHGIISHTTFHLTMIRVAHNYVYDDAALLSDDIYQTLLQWSPSHITTSHGLVSHWMVEANKTCAKYLHEHKIGIFRTVEPSVPVPISSDIVLQQWIHGSGQYEPWTKENHGKLYAQNTSPIRRLVDLMNQTWMISHMVKGMSDSAYAFLDHGIRQLDSINVSMRSIRKLQTNYSLLHQCTVHPESLDEIYEGVVFDPQTVDHGGPFSYMVYLKSLKLLTRVKSAHPVDNHSSTHFFRIFMFTSEDQTKKKIRVMFKGTYGSL